VRRVGVGVADRNVALDARDRADRQLRRGERHHDRQAVLRVRAHRAQAWIGVDEHVHVRPGRTSRPRVSPRGGSPWRRARAPAGSRAARRPDRAR
jgi:hypothetical protein